MTAMLGVARDLRFSRTAHFRPAPDAAGRPSQALGSVLELIALTRPGRGGGQGRAEESSF